jgi:hypothetical protein
MFGLFERLKYQKEVRTETTAILKFLPELQKLIDNHPGWKRAVNEYRKQGLVPLEVATWLSMALLEKLIGLASPEARNQTLAGSARRSATLAAAAAG